MQTDFNLYKVNMKYIRNLHNIDDKVLSVSPQTGKDNRVFVGIVIIVTAFGDYVFQAFDVGAFHFPQGVSCIF